MKIAIIAEKYGQHSDGIATSINRLVNTLAQNRIKISLITYDYKNENYFSSNPSIPEYSEQKVNDYLTIFKIGPLSDKANIMQPGFMASQKRNFFSLMIQILAREKPELIHGFHILKSGFFAAMAGKKLGIPSIVSARGNDISRDIFDFSKFGAIKWTLDTADFITFVNDVTMNDCMPLLGSKRNYRIVLNGCDIQKSSFSKDKILFLKKSLGIAENAFVIGFCGAVREKKGIPYLIEAFKKAAVDFPDSHLLIVGRIAKDYQKDAQLKAVNQKGVKGKITLTGTIPSEKVNNYYALMNVHCVPSINDGLSNSLLEGLCLGVPTIASDIFSSIVTDKEHALLFKNRNANELFQKIVLLRKNSGLRRRLSENSITLIKEKFPPQREAEENIQIYKELLE